MLWTGLYLLQVNPGSCILRRIILLCQQIPKGITDQVIQNDMPQFDAQQRVMAINRLLSTVRNHILSDDPSFPTFS